MRYVSDNKFGFQRNFIFKDLGHNSWICPVLGFAHAVNSALSQTHKDNMYAHRSAFSHTP